MTGDTVPGELLAIGEILKPRGTRGELKVRLLCNDFDHFRECLDAGEILLWRDRPGRAARPAAAGKASAPALPHPPKAPARERRSSRAEHPLGTAAPRAETEATDDHAQTAARQCPSETVPFAVQIESARYFGGCAFVHIAGIESMDDAEGLRGCLIGLRADLAPSLEEGSYYQYELEGLDVIRPDGEKIGTAERVLENPAHDLLSVRPADPRLKPFLVPLVSAFVKRVDLERGRIEVDLPDGLIESQQ
jgi:16S rRNA processing protein RimM